MLLEYRYVLVWSCKDIKIDFYLNVYLELVYRILRELVYRILRDIGIW